MARSWRQFSINRQGYAYSNDAQEDQKQSVGSETIAHFTMPEVDGARCME
jgi:hypothetical protein